MGTLSLGSNVHVQFETLRVGRHGRGYALCLRERATRPRFAHSYAEPIFGGKEGGRQGWGASPLRRGCCLNARRSQLPGQQPVSAGLPTDKQADCGVPRSASFFMARIHCWHLKSFHTRGIVCVHGLRQD